MKNNFKAQAFKDKYFAATIAILLSLLSLSVSSQTLYVPSNPDSLKLPITVNGAVRSIYVSELTKNKQSNLNVVNAALNGVTTASGNVSTALQALIGSNKTIFIPNGTYNLTSVVNIANISNLKIIADRGATFTTTQDIIFNISGVVSNVDISGINFVTTRSSTTDGGGLITIANYTGSGSDNMDNIEIHHCAFTSTASCSNGVSITAENAGIMRNIRLHDNNFINIGRIGIELQNHVNDGVYRMRNVDISHNYLKDIGLIQTGSTYAPVGISTSGDVRDVRISNNTVIDVHSTSAGKTSIGIENAASANVTISNNTLTAESYAMQAIAINPLATNLTQRRLGCIISDNIIKITGITESGNILARGIVLSYSLGADVKNNTVTTTGLGMAISNSSENYIQGNRFYCLKDRIIYFSNTSTSNKLVNNYIDNSGATSNAGLIFYDGSGVTNNRLYGNSFKMQGDAGGLASSINSASNNDLDQYRKIRTETVDFQSITLSDEVVIANISGAGTMYLYNPISSYNQANSEITIKNISTGALTISNPTYLPAGQKATIYTGEAVTYKNNGSFWYALSPDIPVAPTASAGTATTQVATTSFVDAVTIDPLVKSMQHMGSTMKTKTLGLSPLMAFDNTPLTDNAVIFIALDYLLKPVTITGVRVSLNPQGTYTGDQNNKVGLFLSNGSGTLTLVASSTNDATLWNNAGSSGLLSKAFTSTYSASPGQYYVGLLYNQSAQTTAPRLSSRNFSELFSYGRFDLTNNYFIAGIKTAQNDLPATITTSAVSIFDQFVYVEVY